jgi:hypothetical protein
VPRRWEQGKRPGHQTVESSPLPNAVLHSAHHIRSPTSGGFIRPGRREGMVRIRQRVRDHRRGASSAQTSHSRGIASSICRSNNTAAHPGCTGGSLHREASNLSRSVRHLPGGETGQLAACTPANGTQGTA